jgi:carbamoyltransferase
MEERLGPARNPNEEIHQKHIDLAASLQAVTEETYLHVLRHAQQVTKQRKLALAGGVAFNSVANGKILNNTEFDDIYIQSAAGDAGTSLGSASYVYNSILKNARNFVMSSSYWGPSYSDSIIESALVAHDISFRKLPDEQLLHDTASAISEGKIIGWFQGRVEWGPRALGNRSILVDPRNPDMPSILNDRIKRRENFRPFAPSILLESTSEYFEQSYPDPFMLKVYNIKQDKRSIIPAVTHVDGTGRLQTVSQEDNPRYWSLIKEFENITGIPVLLNTSFNENEPIVCTPDEAIECFLRAHMDMLVIGNYIAELELGN